MVDDATIRHITEIEGLTTRESIVDTARQIAEIFKPEQVILFGSYAYGRPTADSDVDLLVVMNTSLQESWQAYEIRKAINYSHPLDLVVKTPEQLHKRLNMGDFFCARS